MKGLLSFMEAEDRSAVLRYYEARFDDAGYEGEQELIRTLGSPVRQVLLVEKQYRERQESPDAQSAGGAEPEETAAEDVAGAEPDAVGEAGGETAAESAGPDETAEEPDAFPADEAESEPEEPLPEPETEPEPVMTVAAQPAYRAQTVPYAMRKAPMPPDIVADEAPEEGGAEEEPQRTEGKTSAGRVIGAILLTPFLIVLALLGLVLTVALALVGLTPGVAFGAAAVYMALYAAAGMTYLPDILVVVGCALAALALAVLFLWLGIWLLVGGIGLVFRTLSRIYSGILGKGGRGNE